MNLSRTLTITSIALAAMVGCLSSDSPDDSSDTEAQDAVDAQDDDDTLGGDVPDADVTVEPETNDHCHDDCQYTDPIECVEGRVIVNAQSPMPCGWHYAEGVNCATSIVTCPFGCHEPLFVEHDQDPQDYCSPFEGVGQPCTSRADCTAGACRMTVCDPYAGVCTFPGLEAAPREVLDPVPVLDLTIDVYEALPGNESWYHPGDVESCDPVVVERRVEDTWVPVPRVPHHDAACDCSGCSSAVTVSDVWRRSSGYQRFDPKPLQRLEMVPGALECCDAASPVAAPLPSTTALEPGTYRVRVALLHRPACGTSCTQRAPITADARSQPLAPCVADAWAESAPFYVGSRSRYTVTADQLVVPE